jgi:FkbM family methyltransferase
MSREAAAPDTISHHPAVARATPRTVTVPPRCFVEFGGAVTRAEWVDRPVASVEQVTTVTAPSAPDVDEEYFEWIDLLEAVEQARGEFVMVELGAGYGRWSVRGALAARERGLIPRCVAVEAEPTHARWLRQHFLDNDLRPGDHELLWAAIGAEGGFAPFRSGAASASYGQHVTRRTSEPYPTAAERRRLRARSVLGRPPRHGDDERSMWVPCLSLADILAPYPLVDLIDSDVQGAELGVMRPAMHALNTRVRRVHIGTHGAEIERGLRELFSAHGWQPLYDFASQSVAATPYGTIRFVDGIQSWINPEVGRDREAVPRAAADASELERLASRVRILKKKIARLTTERQ